MIKEKKLDLYSIKSVDDEDRKDLYIHILDKVSKVVNTKDRIEVLSNRNMISVLRRQD